jgi:hypothetical protein
MIDKVAREPYALGIVPAHDRKTVRDGLRRGWWSVNLPVFLLIIAGYSAPILILSLTGTGNADTPLPQPDSHSFFLNGACRASSAIFSVTAARSTSRKSSTARVRPLWTITWAL